MRAVETFLTEHLAAERPRPEDFGRLRRLHRDPEVMATLSADGDPLSEEETRRFLRERLEHWARHGYGLWMFRDSAEDRFVGYCGLGNVEVDGVAEVELLYAVASEYWGRGLATEMAEAALAVGFGRLGLASVVSYTLPTNPASRRVMEKMGFVHERDIVHAGLPHVLYRLTAADWERGRVSGQSDQRNRARDRGPGNAPDGAPDG